MNIKEQVYSSALQSLALLMYRLPQNIKSTFTAMLETEKRHDNKRLLEHLNHHEKIYFIKASVYLSLMTKVYLPPSLEKSFSNPELQRFLDAVSFELSNASITQKAEVSAAVDTAVTSYDINQLTIYTERAFFLMNNSLIASQTITANLYILVFIEMLIYLNNQSEES